VAAEVWHVTGVAFKSASIACACKELGADDITCDALYISSKELLDTLRGIHFVAETAYLQEFQRPSYSNYPSC